MVGKDGFYCLSLRLRETSFHSCSVLTSFYKGFLPAKGIDAVCREFSLSQAPAHG